MATSSDRATSSGDAVAATSPAASAGAGPSARELIPPRRGAPLPLAAVVAAGWAALVSYLPMLLLSLLGTAGSSGSAAGAARVALAGWLLSHGVALDAGPDRITLVPLAITGLAVWRLGRAGVHASRAVGGQRSRSVWPAVRAALAVAVAYGGLGALAALLVDSPGLSASVPRAAATFAAVAAVSALIGAVRHSSAGRQRLRRLPATLNASFRAGLTAALFTLAAGAAAAGYALAVRGGVAADMLGSYRAGVLGQAGITLICLAYAPNLAVWGAAYLLGPGFSVGVDTVISPGEVLLGPVPAVPTLAGLPSGAASGFAPVFLAAPLVGAICAGWLLVRRPAQVRPRAPRGWIRTL
ncbi:MAG TPA: DUF6350 family protein, partial [Micromonosporaceae bacterium]